MNSYKFVFVLIFVITGCSMMNKEDKAMSFMDDVSFLQKHTPVEILQNKTGNAQIAICPEYQGRVMTSTANGPKGASFGWINYEALDSGVNNPHMNAFGGEERIWLGPEGGQYSIYFKKGDPFDLDHWYTPKAFNEQAFKITGKGEDFIKFEHDTELTNYSGTDFKVNVSRVVRLLPLRDIIPILGIADAANLSIVGYQTENTITNTGDQAWVPETGLLSIWILGMFNPSPATTVFIPYIKGPEEELGPVVNDVYFGKVPENRLQINDGILFFKADGKYRSKIGISPQRCIPYAGSYNANDKVLTIVTFSFNDSDSSYVNSLWEIQDKPYAGDVLNSYNDGPSTPDGKPMGPFYELESSSAAAQLSAGESKLHVHTTIHIKGAEHELDPIVKKMFNITLSEIVTAFF